MARKRSEPLLGGLPWSDLWPRVEDHLRRVLRFRVPAGVDSADVIQETAARLFARAPSLATEVDVFRFATRMAVNVATDLRRRASIVGWQPLLGDVPASQDLESEVLSRAELEELCREVAAGRIDLNGLTADPDDQSSPSALKSRRYRARKRLVRWSDRIAGGFLLPRIRWLLSGLAATAALAPAFVPGQIPWSSQPPAERIEQRLSRPQGPVVPIVRWTEGASISPHGREKPGRAPAAHPSERDSAVYTPDLDVRGPGGAGAETGNREYPPEAQPDHIVCVRQISPLPDTCAGHPLRQLP